MFEFGLEEVTLNLARRIGFAAEEKRQHKDEWRKQSQRRGSTSGAGPQTNTPTRGAKATTPIKGAQATHASRSAQYAQRGAQSSKDAPNDKRSAAGTESIV